MDEQDERTSLVRSNGTLNGVSSPSHNNNNNNYNTGNGRHHQARPSRTPSSPEDFARQNPRTFLVQAQRSLAFFQTWAANVLHGGGESSVVNWVQNARVARTFMMIINVILAVLAFLLTGIEIVEMALREPILDYLLPESDITLFIAGLTIVACTFGFAVAYNLLVEDTTNKGDERDNDEDRRGNCSGGNGGDSGPRTPTLPRSTDSLLRQNNDPPLVLQQQKRRPRLMFTKASTYLLNGNAVFLVVVLVVFMISIAQRSVHLSRMDIELNSAWTESIRHRTKLIRDFELRHQCCGFNSIKDRPFPPVDKPGESEPQTCSLNPAYGFQVPCKAELAKDFERWQKRIQHLLLVQVTMLLKERKQEGLGDAESQAEATATVPVVDGRGDAQYERPLLEDVTPHNGGTPFLVNVEAEPGAEDMQVSMWETQVLPELPVPNNQQQGNDFKVHPYLSHRGCHVNGVLDMDIW
ncbi:hypothetical protein BGX26_004506 [Mortierella sp. AD094]|nr:hypothetical protein BGX26_004506 [Mortierella sp. AD094]